MKLFYSFIKELKLASRGFYFNMELVLALIFLAVLLFAIPDKFSRQDIEYIYLDLPIESSEQLINLILEEDLDGEPELTEIKSNKDMIPVALYESEDKKVYVAESREDVIRLGETERPKVSAIISATEDGKFYYEYYLQGYETERLKNLYKVFHVLDMDLLEEEMDKQEVRSLAHYTELNNNENIIPVLLVYNGSLMGIFIIAAYIFRDKQEGVIKAYAVTASTIVNYLLSKIGVILVTSILTSIIIVVPIMGLNANYLLMLALLLSSGFFASALGLVISSFYKNMMQAFGAMYIIMIVMLLPNIAYFIPSWEPNWIKIIPSYPLIQAFKETIVMDGDTAYILMTSLGFLAAALILFFYARKRFKKSLTL